MQKVTPNMNKTKRLHRLCLSIVYIHKALFVTAENWKQAKMAINRKVGKQIVVHLDRIVLSYRKNEVFT